MSFDSIDGIAEKPKRGDEIVALAKVAFAEADELGVMQCLSENCEDLAKMNGQEWLIFKAKINKFARDIKPRELEEFRKPKFAEVTDGYEIEKATEKMAKAYCMSSGRGYAYMILDNGILRPIPQQEMTPLVRLMAGSDKLKESMIYEKIHNERKIETISNHIAPNGRTHYEMIHQVSGEWKAICHISIEEMLDNQLASIPNYPRHEEFEKLVKSEYAYMFHIYEYALALKFCFEKSNCIWLREHSDTGKTFFLGAREAKDYLFLASEEINEDEFKGDGPEKWGKKLFFFVDEAKKFSSAMKSPILPYRMNYGGRVELDMPLIILSSDNIISDLDNGVDKQISNRVINVHYQTKNNFRRWMDEGNLDPTTAQALWQKMILTHIKDMLNEWNQAESLQAVASKKVKEFKERYKTTKMVDLGDSVIETLDNLLCEIRDESGYFTGVVLGKGRDFKDMLVNGTKPNEALIKSPKKFFSMLMDEYMPEKKKSFEKSYPNTEAIASMLGTTYASRRPGCIRSGEAKGSMVKALSYIIKGDS